MGRTSILLVILILVTFSCEEGFLTDCDQCYTTNDHSVFLEIRYRSPDYIPVNGLVTLYEGSISDSLILEKYYLDNPVSFIKYYAILQKDYSATLEFTLDGKKYITTAAACPRVRYDETTCDEPCWYVYDNILDLRLRYD